MISPYWFKLHHWKKKKDLLNLSVLSVTLTRFGATPGMTLHRPFQCPQEYILERICLPFPKSKSLFPHYAFFKLKRKRHFPPTDKDHTLLCHIRCFGNTLSLLEIGHHRVLSVRLVVEAALNEIMRNRITRNLLNHYFAHKLSNGGNLSYVCML